ncbi:PTB domain-containing engulfment adapter protein 1-like isoform X2 [Prorops nasuta]|uniref:PTB domain-containing engulfment adapter protein 1-like isoform X2 n=1 Tax=Prorops nasuta TaxID=863751 RepID=UPI0034CE3613
MPVRALYCGSAEVDKPNLVQVANEVIPKLKFNHKLRKREGKKPPEVELTISIDGVTIQEPETDTTPKQIRRQYSLERIEYCGDNNGGKKYFAFITIEKDTRKQLCYVFASGRLAREIKLVFIKVINLAFDRWSKSSAKDFEDRERAFALKQKPKRLEHENNVCEQRSQDIAGIKGSTEVSSYLAQHNLPDILHPPAAVNDTPRMNSAEILKLDQDWRNIRNHWVNVALHYCANFGNDNGMQA